MRIFEEVMRWEGEGVLDDDRASMMWGVS